MKFTTNIWRAEGHKSRPLIQFNNINYAVLEDLLTVDSYYPEPKILNNILEQIESVESGQNELEENGSEQVIIVIRKEECTLYDNLADLKSDEEIYPTLQLPTLEVKSVIQKWIVERERLIKQIKREEKTMIE